jgi:hypothetical protein
LTRLNQKWHQFIDSTHPDVRYAAKLANVINRRDPQSYFDGSKSFAKYGQGVESWKQVCRRQTLLARSWNDELPTTTESIIRFPAANHFVWRFKPDFDRRLIISTSQAGGVYVTDMDSGAILWSLQGEDEVRGYAHLEYQDGTAVWDRFGNSLEVWKTDLPGLQRGHFRNVGLLSHDDVDTRGFQLSHNTLCVVSTDGQGFVYDVPPGDTCPVLRTHLDIQEGAIGHLDQNAHAVMYSMGAEGYHFYEKSPGASLGNLRPELVDPFKVYHISHPEAPQSDIALGQLPRIPSPALFMYSRSGSSTRDHDPTSSSQPGSTSVPAKESAARPAGPLPHRSGPAQVSPACTGSSRHTCAQ